MTRTEFQLACIELIEMTEVIVGLDEDGRTSSARLSELCSERHTFIETLTDKLGLNE